jgi:PAS domain S-box-containing protein
MSRNHLALIGTPLFIVALLEIILGTLLLVHNPRKSRVNKSVAVFSFFTAAFSLDTALMYVVASFGHDITFLARANWIGWLMIPAAVQLVFYMQDENSKAARIAGYLLYPFWIIVLCISLPTGLIESGNYSLLPYIDRSGPLGKPLRFVGILQIFWVIVEIYRLRRHVSGIRRSQLNYFTNGLLIFTAGGTVVAGIFPLLGGFGLEPGLSSYFSLPWVALTFYAMTRYRLFDIRSVISRLATIGLLSAVFSVVQIGLFKLLEPLLGATLAIAASLFIIGFAFFSTANQKAKKKIQDLVLQNKFDYQRILQESINAIITILDLNELLNYIIRCIKTSLGVEHLCLHLREKDGHYRQPWSIEYRAQLEACPVDGVVIDWVKRSGDVVIREELQEKLPEEHFGRLNAWMKEAKTEVIIPLFYNGELQGIITLGAKGNGEPYAQSDIDLLEALAGHAAIAIANARLYDEARRSKESLQESEAKFRTLAQALPAALFILRGRTILYANPSAGSLAGYTNEEFLSMDFLDIVHPDFRETVQEGGSAALSDGQPPSQCEFKVVRKNGGERWVLMTSERLEYEGQPALIGTLLDITEHKALEGQLRYAQKMEAIGKLAGGVAHDFNNVLTAVAGYGNLLHDSMKKDDPLRSYVDQILASTEKASTLTQTLLAFGKKQVVNLRSEDLNDIVRRMEKLLAGFVRKGIDLSMRYSNCRMPVLVDSSQIERVIMNLLVNARDAMPQGGTITIETGTSDLDSEFIKTWSYGKAGSYAVVSMSDTGIGMDAAIKEKIFEPFFTTKGLEKGTGFGLSIVYDIVKEHRGYIAVDSEPGKGTTFRIYLPLISEDKEAKPAAPVAPAQGSETILVADNEDDVRELMKAVLEGSGYTVIEAVDGEDAVAKFVKHKDAIQLVILDVVMPRMNGIEAYTAIKRKQRKTKMLFTSGYSEDLIQKRGKLDKHHQFLVKPFSTKDLLSRVREILDRDAMQQKVEKRGSG